MVPIQPFALDEDIRRRGQKGYCSYSSDGTGCGQGIIKSHTVQRGGGLAAIAEGKSRVLTVKPSGLSAMIDHGGRPPPKEIGIGQASVFPGFCGHHDNTVFQEIEAQDIKLTADEAALFAYRAVAYERFKKAVEIAHAPMLRQADCGRPLDFQAFIQDNCSLREAGAQRALACLDKMLLDYRQRIDRKDLHDFRYRAYRFDALLPIVCCGAFLPELSVDGTALQNLARGNAEFDQLTLTVTSYLGQSVVVFAWIGANDGPAASYVDAFDAVADAEKSDVVIQLALEQLENIFLRISWWEDLPNLQRTELFNRVFSGIGLNDRTAGPIVAKSPRLSNASIVQRTQT